MRYSLRHAVKKSKKHAVTGYISFSLGFLSLASVTREQVQLSGLLLVDAAAKKAAPGFRWPQRVFGYKRKSKLIGVRTASGSRKSQPVTGRPRFGQ
jgi:hypothetical protein